MANIYDYQGNIIQLDTTNMQVFMNNAIANATNLISGGYGGHIVINKDNEGKPQQIYVMDTDNVRTAVNVWRFSREGLAHSKRGYGGPYSNVALTPDGQINASLITTGQLDADLLKNGTIIDATGENFWNLITGYVQFSKNIRIGNNTFNKTITDLADLAKNYTDVQLNDYSSTLNEIVSSLQGQIDGQIESWYYDYQPTLNNLPASKWTTEEEKEKHNGDIFYWETPGYTYRFTRLGGNWYWKLIEDSEITQAISAAREARNIANDKSRIFTQTPYPPYDIGDLWVQGESGDILKCKTPKTEDEIYSFSDWEKASKYTDDSSLNNWIYGDFASIISNINQGLIDGKISTYYQEDDPSHQWLSLQEMSSHQGDIWFDSGISGYYRWSGRHWEEIQAAPTDEFAEIVSQKADIFVDAFSPPVSAKRGDLWFRGPEYPILTYVDGQWVEYNNYTNNDALFDFIYGDYADSLANLKNQIDRKAETWYQEDDPAQINGWYNSLELMAEHEGDLWYRTTDDVTFRYTGGNWVQQSVPVAVFDKIDSKAQIFYNDPNDEVQEDRHPYPPYNVGDLWVQGENGDILRCVTSRDENDEYDEDDWVYASKYGALIDAIGQQLDNKVNTYYGEDDPMDDWDPSEYESHIGDLWCNSELNVISVFNGTGWDAQTSGDIPQEIFDKLDGVSQIFTQVPPATPTVPYYVDDIWIQGANGDMMKCIHARIAQEQYNAADWVKATKYDKGQDAINVIIDSSAGNVFLRKDITTTLTCTVIKGNGTDITNRVTSFHWIKKNADGTVDTSWNRNLAGNTITLTEADVNSKAIFVCEVQFQEE